MVGDQRSGTVKTVAGAARPGPVTLGDEPNAIGAIGQSAGFFDLRGEQVYHVRHSARGVRRAAALICGPFAAERERSYFTLSLWARTIASRGVEALRFDYRGIGESGGRFEDKTISSWKEDAAFCAARLAEAAPGVPLILHGVRLGALIAAELFASGIGDRLLLWAPPASAGSMLSDTMRRTIMTQRMADPEAPWRTREEQAAAIEAGELVNVDGYLWSRALWTDAQAHPLVLPGPSESRPWRVIHVKNGPVRPAPSNDPQQSVRAEPFWESSPLPVPRSEDLVRMSLAWLDGPRAGGAR